MAEPAPLHGGTPSATSKLARQEAIAAQVGAAGFLSVDSIADSFSVSRMTVHRDLEDLDRHGRIRRVRGGASVVRSTQFESGLSIRASTAAAQKRGIARAASHLVADGDVVMMDDSTTALEMIPYLKRLTGITVVSNYLLTIMQLAHDPHINLISIGGQFRQAYSNFLGILTEEAIGSLSTDVLFMSTSSLRGTALYHPDEDVARVKQAMLAAAARRVLLVDHSKLDLIALYKFAEVADFTHVVIDSGVCSRALDALHSAGVEVLVAEPLP